MPSIAAAEAQLRADDRPVLLLDTCMLLDIIRATMRCLGPTFVQRARQLHSLLTSAPPACSLAVASVVPTEWNNNAPRTVNEVRAHLNPRLEVEGLLRTMYDPRNTLALNVTAELEKHFGDRLFRTIIPRNVRLAEAPSHGIPVLQLEPQSKGALAYLALAGEMLRRMEAAEAPAAAA